MSDKSVAVITGASRGIGKAIAMELASLDYDIVISHFDFSAEGNPDESMGLETQEQIKSTGVECLSVRADVSNGDDCFVRFAMPHETTFKRVFFEDDNKVRLQPRNEKYSPAIVESDKISGLYRAIIKYERL